MIRRVLFLLLILLWPLTAHAQINVRLAWDPNSESDLAGYITYVGTSSRVYPTAVDVGNVTLSPTITLPDPTKIYYFAVVAYNAAQSRSPYSAEVTFQPPSTPPPVTCTYTLSGPSTVGAGGGQGPLAIVSSDPTCPWIVSSSQSWLTVQPANGSGTASSGYSASMNSTQTARSSVVSLNGDPKLTMTQDVTPPPPANPCDVAVPRITPGSWDNHFKLGSYGRIFINDLDWTTEVGDRHIVWIETQLGAQKPQRITEPGVIATLTSMTYRSTAKGTFNLVVRAGDDKGCPGTTGQSRPVRVN